MKFATPLPSFWLLIFAKLVFMGKNNKTVEVKFFTVWVGEVQQFF